MGLIFSRIYDKPSTRDTLEKIEQELQNIEERRWDKIKREQFIVQILSFLPITILIANLCILIYPSDSTWRDRLLLSVPIMILNLVIWMGRKMVQWYSKWSLDNEESRLRKLRKQKKKILEMVCETESYRVATELLEKYDPKQLRRREKPTERPTSPQNTSLTKIPASPSRTPKQAQQTPLQHPIPAQANHNQSINLFSQPPLVVPVAPPPTPVSRPINKSQLNTTSTNLNASISTTIAASSVQGRPVRPILKKDRSIFEKMVDWVVSDGPDNRFALICRFCYSHNGMCLAEEYETINFRCCYCYNLNTASNKRHQIHDQLQPDREKSELSSIQPKKIDANTHTVQDSSSETEESVTKSKNIKLSNSDTDANSNPIQSTELSELIEESETTNCDTTANLSEKTDKVVEALT